VVEHLPSKYKALNSNPSTAKKKREKQAALATGFQTSEMLDFFLALQDVLKYNSSALSP
jgi:hypothetical protein